jgi:WD40 repeat protein
VEPDLETGQLQKVGGEAAVWTLAGRRLIRPIAHPDTVWAVALSPRSRVLLTGCEDAFARFFDAGSGLPIGRRLEHEGTVRTVAFRPDGRAALTSSAGGDRNAAARLWDLPPGLDVGSPPSQADPPGAIFLAFSPDGKTLLGGYGEGSARFWDVADRAQGIRETGSRLQHPGRLWVTNGGFSPDGRTVLTVTDNQEVRLWDRDSGRLRHIWNPSSQLRSVGYNPNGGEVLISTRDSGVGFWDAATGKPRGTALQHPKPLRSAAYSADGLTVWTAAEDDTFRQWDRATGKVLATCPIPSGAEEAEIHPGGRAELRFQGGRYAQLSDLASLARSARAGSKPDQGPLIAHPAQVIQGLIFSPDGSFAASAGSDQTGRIWDVATGKQVGPALTHPYGLTRVAVRPDGRMLAFSGTGGTRLWEVPAPVAGSPQEVRHWVEQVTGLELDDQGSVRPLRRP